MALAEQSQLIVTIRLNDQMSPTAVKVGKQMQDIERKTVSLRKAVGRVGEGLKTGLANSAKIAVAGVGFLAYNIKQGIDELVEWEDAQLQITAALKSTNAVSGVTAKMTEKLALKYANLSNYEDDVVLGAEALLLRFPNIKKKAFEPTLAAATDLAAGMGKDLPSAARTLALALNNPNAGLGRLTRAGITFTEQQKKQIKTLTDAGKVGKAQAIILAKVNKQYGGSAQKSTEGYRGSVTRLNKAVKDLQQALADPLIGPLGRLARRLAQFAKSPEVQQGLRNLGEAVAGIFSNENLDAGFASLKDGLTFLRELDWTQIRGAVSVSAEIMKTAVGMFTSLPAPLQGALVSLLAVNKLTGGLGTAAIKGIGELMLSGLRTITAANVTVIGANVTGAGAGIPGAAGGAAGAAGAAGRAGVGAVPFLGGVLGALALNQFFNDPSRRKDLGAPVGGELGTGALGQLNWDVIQFEIMRVKQNVKRLMESGELRPGGPGPGRTGLDTQTPQIQTLNMIQRMYEQGKLSASRALDIWEATQSGNKTYEAALRELRLIKGAQGEVKTAIKGMKYQFLLQPRVTISAAATADAIVFAQNGQRLIIK